MGHIREFSPAVRLLLRTYRWRRIDPVPWTQPAKPLADSRLALLSSAGFVAPGQEPLDESVRGGDPSFREIPGGTAVADLVNTHRSESFDHRPMESDPNLAFPLDRVHEMAGEGRLGEINRRHFSFMGSLTATGRFTRDSVPAMAERLVEDEVDVALLVPV